MRNILLNNYLPLLKIIKGDNLLQIILFCFVNIDLFLLLWPMVGRRGTNRQSPLVDVNKQNVKLKSVKCSGYK